MKKINLTEDQINFLLVVKEMLSETLGSFDKVLEMFYKSYPVYFEGSTLKTFKNRVKKVFENDLEINGKIDTKYMIIFVKCLRMTAKIGKSNNLQRYNLIIENLKGE